MWQDLKHGAGMLAKNPGFTLVAIVSIAIRMAVGANPGAVMRMVLRHGLLLAVGGTVVGLIAGAALGGLLRAVFPFPHVATFDLTTYLVVVPALLATTLLAASIPARRAARIDPLRAIRTD